MIRTDSMKIWYISPALTVAVVHLLSVMEIMTALITAFALSVESIASSQAVIHAEGVGKLMNKEDEMDIIRLRTLTFKSLLGFGQYKLYE